MNPQVITFTALLIGILSFIFSSSAFSAPATEETLLVLNSNLDYLNTSIDQLISILVVFSLFMGVAIGFVIGQQR